MEVQELYREMYKGNITRRSADLGCGGDGARLTECWMRKRRKLLGLQGVWRVFGGFLEEGPADVSWGKPPTEASRRPGLGVDALHL